MEIGICEEMTKPGHFVNVMMYGVPILILFTLQASAKANPLPNKMTIFQGNFLDISLNSRRPGGGLFTA